jgi:hypothetical protein
VLVENSKRFPRRKSLAEAGKNLSPSLSTGSGHLTPIISLWLVGNIILGGTLLWYKKQAFNRRRHRAPRLFLYHHLVIGGSGCGERIDHCLIITFLFYSCLPDWNFSFIRAVEHNSRRSSALSIVFIIDKVCCVLPAVPKVRVELLPSWAVTRHAETNTHSRIAFHAAFLSRALTFSAAEQPAWYTVMSKRRIPRGSGNFLLSFSMQIRAKVFNYTSAHCQEKM